MKVGDSVVWRACTGHGHWGKILSITGSLAEVELHDGNVIFAQLRDLEQ